MLARPRQVTIAAWVIIVGSILTVIGVAQQFQVLGSVATTDTIQKALDELKLDSITVDQIESLARVLGMVAAGCATAAAILAWQVMAKRSTEARLALSILALPLFVAGISTGGVHSTAAVVAIGFLWTPLARSWFEGTWKPEPPRPATSPAAEAPSTRRIGQVPPTPTSTPTPPAAPPVAGPVAGSSTPPPMAAWPPPAHPATMPPQGQRSTAPVSERPTAVVVAVVLTWIFSVLVAAVFVVGLSVLLADPTEVMDRLREMYPTLVEGEQLTVASLRAAAVFLGTIVVLWSLSACVLAFFVLRGAAWARIVLMVCAGLAGATLLLATAANPVMALPLAAAVVTFLLLRRRDVAAWLR